MIEVNFITINGDIKKVLAEEGLSLLEVAQLNDIELSGNCGGNLACASCHVIINEKWFKLIDKAIEEEEDLLDIIFNLTPTSRLGCQVFTAKEINGIVVTIPKNS